MLWGLIILYVGGFIGLLISSHEHGKERDGKHNFFVTFIAYLIQFILTWWALGWVFW